MTDRTVLVEKALAGRSVFLTGHTGFTGSWLAEWLHQIGCHVTGYSLKPETDPNLYDLLGGEERFHRSYIADINEFDTLQQAIGHAKPDIVFHLAAQPLVRRAYRDPLEAFRTNVIGTANVLEAARHVEGIEAFVCITTDKVYDNKEWPHPYRENDELGGKDPYSASKACAELVTRCYQQTMVDGANNMKIATARGGNIIGGGDWSEDRIVPDFYRAMEKGETLTLRYPGAIRPWQHVLSACHGYMAIADFLLNKSGKLLAEDMAWNIGPSDPTSLSVGELVGILNEFSTSVSVEHENPDYVEAMILKLDTSKTSGKLGAHCPWTTRETVQRTAEWYADYYQDPALAVKRTASQISSYRKALSND